VDVDWDRVYVFGAYSWPDQTAKVLGFRWLDGARSASTIQDRYQLLVFTKGSDVVTWVDFDRGRAALDVKDGVLTREQAVFRKVRTAWGTVVLPISARPREVKFVRSGPTGRPTGLSDSELDQIRAASESELREFERQRALGFPRAEGR